MKFITPRNSATGKKFKEIQKRREEAFDAQKKFARQYRVKQWRGAYFAVWGGISAVEFEKDVVVDKKVWKNVNGSKDEWMPRKNIVLGKVIYAEIDRLPVVRDHELNDCVGVYIPFGHIGYNSNHSRYFGFSVSEKTKFKIPKDCKEITTTKYNSLFKIKK